MRISLFIGILTLVLGIFLSYLAQALIATQTMGALQTTAAIVAAVLFVLFSASMLGIGAALVAHWILGFFGNWVEFAIEMILSFGALFMGIGATIMSRDWMTALHVFFSFFTASIALFMLSFMSLFGGVAKGLVKIKKYIKKRFAR